MGGRGGSSGRSGSGGIALSAAQERKLEDTAQFNDAKHYGFTRGAKHIEYTDSNGKIRKVDTGRPTGGTYRTSYSEDVANYAKMSTQSLNAELSKLFLLIIIKNLHIVRQARVHHKSPALFPLTVKSG